MNQTDPPASMSCGLARLPSPLARFATLLFSGWILIVLVLGARMAYASIRESLDQLRSTITASQADASLTPAFPDSAGIFVAAALILYAVVVLTILLSQVFRPRLTVAIAFVVPVSIFVLAAFASGAIAAALAACAVVAMSWLAGDIVLRLVQAPVAHVHVGAVTALRIALGLGGLGLAVLVLGVFNGVSMLPIVVLALIVAVVWMTLHRQSLRRASSLISALPRTLPRLDWFESLLIALTAAFFTFAALAAFTPETILTGSDSVRQHLPQAREIWQDHAVLFHSTIQTPSASVLGASLNAVAFGFGGYTAVRILQVLVSLCCLLAIAGLGATLGGRLAGIAAAAFFSAMPLVLWLTGHAYPDLLAVLFTCASVQCAVLWQADGRKIWLVLAGTLAGFSLDTKQISAVVVVALLIALAIAARPGASIVDRVQSTLIVAVACLLAVIPWFVHSAILTGTVPLLGTVLAQLDNVPLLTNLSQSRLPGVTGATPDSPVAASAGVYPGGVTRTLAGIIAGPWDLTFQGAYENWRSVRYGEFGILLAMFLPLIFVNLCSRGIVLVAITTAVSFVAWVFTIQVPRHLLPSLALLAVLAGIAAAHASQDRLAAVRIPYGRLVQVAAIAGLALTPFYLLPNSNTGFPISVVTGATAPDDYLARVDPATPALRAATALLPADTPVGYIGEWQGDQSATEARLVYLGSHSADSRDSLDTQVGETPEAIFEYLKAWGINYLIWDRPDTRPQDIGSTLLSGDFLLQYTTILGGDNGIYLFAVHPDGVPDPTTRDNLLQDPEFSSLSNAENVWNGSKRDLAEDGEFQPKRQRAVSQRVEVAPGQPYLLVLNGSCESTKGQTTVSLTWRDARDNLVGATSDSLKFGVSKNSTLIWRVAPGDAASVEVGISAATGTPCVVTRIGMYAYGAP